MGQRGAPDQLPAAIAFGYVPPPFGPLWPAIVALLDSAVVKGGNKWGDVKAALAEETAQLWLAIEAGRPIVAAVSRMDGETFEVWLAGGAVLRRLGDLETAIQAAREGGASNGRIIGRKGWRRVLAPYGWHPDGDDLVKDFQQ